MFPSLCSGVLRMKIQVRVSIMQELLPKKYGGLLCCELLQMQIRVYKVKTLRTGGAGSYCCQGYSTGVQWREKRRELRRHWKTSSLHYKMRQWYPEFPAPKGHIASQNLTSVGHHGFASSSMLHAELYSFSIMKDLGPGATGMVSVRSMLKANLGSIEPVVRERGNSMGGWGDTRWCQVANGFNKWAAEECLCSEGNEWLWCDTDGGWSPVTAARVTDGHIEVTLCRLTSASEVTVWSETHRLQKAAPQHGPNWIFFPSPSN